MLIRGAAGEQTDPVWTPLLTSVLKTSTPNLKGPSAPQLDHPEQKHLPRSSKPQQITNHQQRENGSAGNESGASSLLDVDDDDAKRPHQPQSLEAQEPEQHPEDEDHHGLHGSVPKVHLAEAQPQQTLVDHPEQRAHPLAVVQLGLRGRLVLQPLPVLLVAGGSGSMLSPAAINL